MVKRFVMYIVIGRFLRSASLHFTYIISSYHHIHFRALFSSTEGWAFWQVFLEGVLSTQNGSEGQQNPYLASFCHSPALHPMISLACQIFSVQPHSACVLLQSSLCCALHVQIISSYWWGAPHLSPGFYIELYYLEKNGFSWINHFHVLLAIIACTFFLLKCPESLVVISCSIMSFILLSVHFKSAGDLKTG